MIHSVPKPARQERKPRRPVKRVNAKRRRKEWGRAYGSPERVQFVASLPCAFGGRWERCAGKIENHHTRNGGRGRKGDAATIVPLCTLHHDELHDKGVATMEEQYGVDLKAEAALTETRWQIASGRTLEQRGAKGGEMTNG